MRDMYYAVRRKWDSVAKPIDGLGRLESIICKIGAIKGSTDISIDKKAAIIFCSDNGIVEEGIAQTDSSVTALVCGNIYKGIATSSKMAEIAKADCFCVDIGVKEDTPAHFINKISRGTENFRHKRAMTAQQTAKAVEYGTEIVGRLRDRYDIIAVGEMGIGNTTTAAACGTAVLGKSAAGVTGRGSGLTDEKYERKIRIIDEALEMHRPKKNMYDILSCVGGYDIAAMAGAYLGAKKYRVPVVADGAVSMAALLLASLEEKDITDYVIGSHRGKEPLSALALDWLGLETVIDGNMALGEGTGAIMLFPLLDMAMAVYNNKTFDDLEMESYKR